MDSLNDEKLTTTLVQSAVQGNYILFRLDSIGANIKRKFDGNENTLWATLKVPEGKEVVIAVPISKAIQEVMPENSISQDVLETVSFDLIKSLEDAITKSEGSW